MLRGEGRNGIRFGRLRAVGGCPRDLESDALRRLRQLASLSSVTMCHTSEPTTNIQSEPAAPILSGVKRSDPEATRAAAIEIARILSDDRCEDIIVVDVRGLTTVSDFLVIASGTSDRQMSSSADDAAEVAERLGFAVYRRNADARTTWVVLDCVDLVVHVFEPNTRAHYDLEMLWGEAPRVEWERLDQRRRDRAGLGGGEGGA